MPVTVIKFHGIEQMRQACKKLIYTVQDQALKAAENAAAREAKKVIEAAAPVGEPKKSFTELPRRPAGVRLRVQSVSKKKSFFCDNLYS